MTAIRVELELADGQFVSRMIHAGETIGRFQQNVARGSAALTALNQAGINVISSISKADSTSRGFLSTLRDVSIVTGMLSLGMSKVASVQNSWMGSIVRINAEFEKLNFQMRGMARSSDPLREAGQNVAWLREKAMEMPFTLKSITDGFVRLNATGIDPTKGALDALADGITAFGGGEEQMKRTLVGISQMSGKGVVQMEEMRQQIAEHMPRAMELMARSMGVSMAQLIKDISTGRVESKAALTAFFGELERTFGGRAKQMMQTFNGQLQRTQTQLELLATSDTIRLKFFDGALKDQLRDLNEFLTSPRAQAYADQLGNAMAKGVQWVRAAIDQLVAFRREIANVAQAAAMVFGANLLFKGLGAFGSALGTLRNELKLVGVQFGIAGTQMNYWTIAANSGAPAAVRIGAAMSTLGAGIRGVLMAGAAFAPWIAGLGMAVYAAGQYFGWFGDRISTAYDELVKFGGESRRQAEETSTAQIHLLEERLAAMQAASTMASPGKWTEEIEKTTKELEEAKARHQRLIQEAGEREDNKALTRFNEQVERKLNLIKSSYDREMIEADQHYNELANKARESGGDVQKVEEERREAYSKAQKKFYEDQIRELEGMLLWEKEVEKYASGEAKKQALERVNSLRGRLRQEKEALQNFQASTVPLLAKVQDPNSAYDKGEKALQRLKESIAGVKAEIAGTSPELAKLQEMLATNKFGDMGREEVQALAEDIRRATAELEAFEELRQGQKDAERDLKNIEKRLFDREMELLEKQQGRTITEGERFILRMNNGAYKGLGPASEIAKALEGVYGRLDIAGSKSNQLGDVLQNNVFGDPTQNKIQGVNDKLRETTLILDQIGQGLNGINFSGLAMPQGTGTLPVAHLPVEAIAAWTGQGGYTSGANLMSGNMSAWGNPRAPGWAAENITSIGFSNGMQAQVHKAAAAAFQGFVNELIDQGYNVKSIGGYNLRNKRGKNSLSEHAFGNAIDINPATNPMDDRLITDMPKNISALAAKWGLSWGGDWKSVKDAMHFEWRGDPNVGRGPTVAAAAALNSGKNAAPTYDPGLEASMQAQIAERVAASEKLKTAAENLQSKETDLLSKEQKQGRADYLEKLKSKAEEAAKGIEGTGKNLKELQDEIRSGKLGSKDLEAPEYKELIAAAKELDRVEADRAKRKSAMSKADSGAEQFKQRQIELARRVEEANARMLDPLEKKSSSAYRSLRQDLDDYLADVERAYGRETEQYRQALALRETMLRQHRNMEASEAGAKWAKETSDINRNLMSESQRRQIALQEEIARIDAEVAAFQGSEQEKVRIVAAAEAQKAALRRQAAAAASPITGMLQQWGDLQTNLANATQSWMNSLADGLTNLIMGTGDLRQVIQGILKDVINMGIKYMMSQIWSGMGNKAGAPNMGQKGFGGKGKQLAGAATKGKAGVFHGGGIVGAAAVHRAVNPGIFVGAKKFHSGGIVNAMGNLAGPKLGRGEVPIIAQEGEGVFTPEQMANMGGFSQTTFAINAPVTVNGSAGTHEQNQDLAKQMAKQMEATMRGVVADEMRKQTRPGNFANNRNR